MNKLLLLVGVTIGFCLYTGQNSKKEGNYGTRGREDSTEWDYIA